MDGYMDEDRIADTAKNILAGIRVPNNFIEIFNKMKDGDKELFLGALAIICNSNNFPTGLLKNLSRNISSAISDTVWNMAEELLDENKTRLR